jgi:NitT/TauT family transport system substrate-binding protein
MSNVFNTALVAMAFLGAASAQAQEVVRLGNIKLAHFGAVSYIKEIAPKCGIKVEERCSPRGST